MHVVAFSLRISPTRRFAPFTTILSVSNETVVVTNISGSGLPFSMLPASVRPGADPVEQAASAFSDPGPLVYAILP